LDVCSNRGVKREMGAPISNGGPGTTGPHAGDGPDHLYFCGECIYANFLICGDGNLRQGEA